MEPIDISATLAAKSDQLNADDLMGGPVTVTILGVSLVIGDQPVAVAISGFQPWKPCKTMRRLLTTAWGADASVWIGKRVTLYRDPAVTFGDGAVGGVRVSHMSGIKCGFTANLTARRGGKKSAWHVAKLPDEQPATSTTPTVEDLQRWAGDAVKQRGWTRPQVAGVLGGPAANTAPDARAGMIAALRGPPPSAPVSDPGEPTEAEKAAIVQGEMEGK